MGPETASSGNLVPRASWEAPGADFGAIWGPFGTPNRSGRGSENELDFGTILGRPKGWTKSSDKGSAGLEEDRRGGVGEGF